MKASLLNQNKFSYQSYRSTAQTWLLAGREIYSVTCCKLTCSLSCQVSSQTPIFACLISSQLMHSYTWADRHLTVRHHLACLSASWQPTRSHPLVYLYLGRKAVSASFSSRWPEHKLARRDELYGLPVISFMLCASFALITSCSCFIQLTMKLWLICHTKPCRGNSLARSKAPIGLTSVTH